MRFLTGSSDNLLQPWLCRVVRPIQSNPASILNPTGQDSTQPNTCLFYKRFVSSSFCRNEGFKWLQDVSGVVCHRFIRLYEESLGAWPRFDIDGVSTLLRCYTEGFSPWVRVHHEVFWRASWRAPRRASWRAAVPEVTGTTKKADLKSVHHFVTYKCSPKSIKRLNHVIILARSVPAEVFHNLFHTNNHATWMYSHAYHSL